MTTQDASGFSLAAFALALLTVGVGTAAGLAYVPVVGAYAGTLAGGFVAGLARKGRPTVEAGVAGVLAGLGVLVAGTLPGNGVVEAVLALGSVGPVTLVISGALSFSVGAFGAHFGEDLRDGLTEPVEEPASRPVTGVSAGSRATTTEPTDAEQTTPEPADAETDDAEQATRESADGQSDDPDPTEFELEGPE